jgi:hypothetical protein
MSKVDGDDLVPEYLVKWQGLPYAESTWYFFFEPNLPDNFQRMVLYVGFMVHS